MEVMEVTAWVLAMADVLYMRLQIKGAKLQKFLLYLRPSAPLHINKAILKSANNNEHTYKNHQ